MDRNARSSASRITFELDGVDVSRRIKTEPLINDESTLDLYPEEDNARDSQPIIPQDTIEITDDEDAPVDVNLRAGPSTNTTSPLPRHSKPAKKIPYISKTPQKLSQRSRPSQKRLKQTRSPRLSQPVGYCVRVVCHSIETQTDIQMKDAITTTDDFETYLNTINHNRHIVNETRTDNELSTVLVNGTNASERNSPMHEENTVIRSNYGEVGNENSTNTERNTIDNGDKNIPQSNAIEQTGESEGRGSQSNENGQIGEPEGVGLPKDVNEQTREPREGGTQTNANEETRQPEEGGSQSNTNQQTGEHETGRPKKIKKSKTGKGYYRCKTCSCFYLSYNVYMKHVQSLHNMKKAPEDSLVPFDPKCKFCELNLDIDHYNAHIRINHKTMYKKSRKVSTKPDVTVNISAVATIKAKETIPKLKTSVPKKMFPKSVLFKCTKCSIHFLKCKTAVTHSGKCEKGLDDNKQVIVACTICKRNFYTNVVKTHYEQHKHTEAFTTHVIHDGISDKLLYKCSSCQVCFNESKFAVHKKMCSKTYLKVDCSECNLKIAMECFQEHVKRHQLLNFVKGSFILVDVLL